MKFLLWRRRIIYIFFILAILLLDQCFKIFIHSNLLVGQSIPLIKNIFHITFVKNTGAAFGLFKNSTLFFIAISIIAIGFILFILIRSIKQKLSSHNLLFSIGLLLIGAGAFGNLLDRLRLGYVIDFIDVRIWPVFNIADTSITIGSIILVISFIRNKRSLE